MARLTRLSSHSDDRDNQELALPPQRSSRQTTTQFSLSPSPGASFSSDKENRQVSSVASSRGEKRKLGSKETMPSTLLTPSSGTSATPSATKRRRLVKRDGQTLTSQAAHRRELQEVNDTDFYDPDQDQDERRAVRKGLRELAKDLNDSRSEFLQAESSGLADTLQRANEYYKSVKQTSDATIDSRLLVSAADLSYKKTTQLALGDASAGIDVDEFVSKCISFMRRGPTSEESTTTASTSTQRQRRRTSGRDNDGSAAEDSEDEGDALNWDWLGRQACFPHNSRPAVCGFLLGTLSVQKRVRQQTQRRARHQRVNTQAVRPEELEQEDLEKQETSNLTTLCAGIRKVLAETQETAPDRVEAEVSDDQTEEEILEIMHKHGISDDGGVPLFRFCINPKSFGQSVENLFYVSFLIREGKVGVHQDSNSLPTLQACQPRSALEAQQKGVQKRQAVFSLDFGTWEDLIQVFDIKDSIIPHREEEDNIQVGARGWYG